jgi:hypothetical protein
MRLSLPARLAVPAFLLLLAACTTADPPARAFPELRWTHEAPLTVAAQGPEIVQEFSPPLTHPHVEHLMPLPPHKAIATWARDRLHTTGVGTQTLRVVIHDASVTEKALHTKSGVSGFLTDEPEATYTATVDVEVQLVNPDGSIDRRNRVTGWRAKSISEKSSLADREAAWFAMVEALMADLDSQLEAGVRENFAGQFLR